MTPKVLPLGLSKELVENGIVLEKPTFYHFNGKVLMWHELRGKTMSEDNVPIPAPLAEEIAERLPFGTRIVCLHSEEGIQYVVNNPQLTSLNFQGESMVEEMVKFYLHLAKEELL